VDSDCDGAEAFPVILGKATYRRDDVRDHRRSAAAVAFTALSDDEQEDAFERISEIRLGRVAGEESATAHMLRSLIRARDLLGHAPSVRDYKQIYRELKGTEDEIEEINRVVRHFGSWHRAVEALGLSETTTARRIEARFRSRRVGKIWKYTDETLRVTLAEAVEHYGRPMTVAEFDWWRERQFELARAEGNDTLHLPSATPYRKRWFSWEGALRHFGYEPDLSGTRLEQP
jgi:Homing endonuclease associated repeat